MPYVTIPSILENISLPIYVVGNSYDGPDGSPFKDSNFRIVRKYEKLKIRVSTGTSGVTLKIPAQSGTVIAQASPDGSQAFNPICWVTDQGLAWKPIGSSGTIFIKYRPYYPSGFIYPVLENLSGLDTYAVRVPGEVASATLNNWEFSAIHSGNLYDGIVVSGSETALLVKGKGFSTYIPHGGSISTLRDQLDNYINENASLITYTHSNCLPTGVATLSGGNVGTLSTSSFSTLLPHLCNYSGILLPAQRVTKQEVLDFQYQNALAGYPLILIATPENMDINGIAKTPDVVLVYGDGLASAEYVKYLFLGKYNNPAISDQKLAVLQSAGLVGFGLHGPSRSQVLDGSQALSKMIITWIIKENYSKLLNTQVTSTASLDEDTKTRISSLPFVKSCTITSSLSSYSLNILAEVYLYGELERLVINVRS